MALDVLEILLPAVLLFFVQLDLTVRTEDAFPEETNVAQEASAPVDTVSHQPVDHVPEVLNVLLAPLAQEDSNAKTINV